LSTLRPESIGRADIVALAARIECLGDGQLGSGFDGRMSVALRGGRHISRAVALSEPSEELIVAKFRANTARLPPQTCSTLENALLNDTPRGQPLVQLALAALAKQ
jgi:hypothetical protein